MSPAFARRLDDATVELLEATSHDGDPRCFLRDCLLCGCPFWVRPRYQMADTVLWCSLPCAWTARKRRYRVRCRLHSAAARAADEATVAMLKATGHDGDPRTVLADCAHCGRPFWSSALHGGSVQRFCRRRCRQAAYWRRRTAAAVTPRRPPATLSPPLSRAEKQACFSAGGRAG